MVKKMHLVPYYKYWKERNNIRHQTDITFIDKWIITEIRKVKLVKKYHSNRKD